MKLDYISKLISTKYKVPTYKHKEMKEQTIEELYNIYANSVKIPDKYIEQQLKIKHHNHNNICNGNPMSKVVVTKNKNKNKKIT